MSAVFKNKKSIPGFDDRHYEVGQEPGPQIVPNDLLLSFYCFFAGFLLLGLLKVRFSQKNWRPRFFGSNLIPQTTKCFFSLQQLCASPSFKSFSFYPEETFSSWKKNLQTSTLWVCTRLPLSRYPVKKERTTSIAQ